MILQTQTFYYVSMTSELLTTVKVCFFLCGKHTQNNNPEAKVTIICLNITYFDSNNYNMQ